MGVVWCPFFAAHLGVSGWGQFFSARRLSRAFYGDLLLPGLLRRFKERPIASDFCVRWFGTWFCVPGPYWSDRPGDRCRVLLSAEQAMAQGIFIFADLWPDFYFRCCIADMGCLSARRHRFHAGCIDDARAGARRQQSFVTLLLLLYRRITDLRYHGIFCLDRYRQKTQTILLCASTVRQRHAALSQRLASCPAYPLYHSQLEKIALHTFNHTGHFAVGGLYFCR